jgi:uncharacterized protein (DUF4213/DUF364 family)
MLITESWIKALLEVLPAEPLPVQDIRIGVFYTAAQLLTGQVGVAFTPRDLHDTVCCPRSAAEAPAAGRLAGQDAWKLAQYALDRTSLRRAVGVAVLNALSACAMERCGVPGGQLHAGLDALAAARVQPGERVVMVGAFVPFIKTLKTSGVDVRVIDKHPGALKADEFSLWCPPQEAPTAFFAEAEEKICIIRAAECQVTGTLGP